MTDWQPIETAPQMEPVDLWSGQCFRYPDALLEYIGDGWLWTDANHHGSIEEAGPFTHWRPLPEPPKGGE